MALTKREKQLNLRKGPHRDYEWAVWQYLLDHSTPMPGAMSVRFTVKGKKDWDFRIEKRMTGSYRYDEDQINKQIQGAAMALAYSNKLSKRNFKICTEIDEGNNYWRKAILWLYRKSRDHLFK